MNNPRHPRQSGFTLVELIITMVILGIIAGIAIPSFVVMLPNYHLKSAARDIFSNMQQARMAAIQANRSYSILFDTANQSYTIREDTVPLTTIKTVNFSDYDSGGGITYGNGNATEAIDGGSFGDFITYTHATFPDNIAVFSPRGLGENTGYVYLANRKGTAYVIGSEISGVIKLRKWVGGTGLKWQ
jgi:prepilin-type N-terminal cleavage/methylation domain-containing protein